MNLVPNYSSGEEESEEEVLIDKKRKETEGNLEKSISKKLKHNEDAPSLPDNFDDTSPLSSEEPLDDALVPPQVKYVKLIFLRRFLMEM